MQGASTAFREPAVSDHMKTFTEGVHCLATIVSKGIDCLMLYRPLDNSDLGMLGSARK